MDKSQIRHAATVLVVRDPGTAPAVLMGQRGAKAAFMPSKYVFPGGAVDTEDTGIPFATPLNQICAGKLSKDPRGTDPEALMAAAIRELWEETGLRLGQTTPGPSPDETASVPATWRAFFDSGARPDPTALRFVFRAITPPGRPRRFDARFFVAPADALMDDPDDFSKASDELSHLHWVPLHEARALDLPFITEVVLGEVAAALPRLDPPDTVPFFQHDDAVSRFFRL